MENATHSRAKTIKGKETEKIMFEVGVTSFFPK